jgi:hypothetical protein
MALIPKVEPKLDKKVVSARLDEEAHTMLQRYAAFLGEANHQYIIGESLKRLFRRDKEFNEWLERIIQVRLQPLTGLNPQTQHPRTQQGQRHRQHDSTYPQFEKLPCSVVSTALKFDRVARLPSLLVNFKPGLRFSRPTLYESALFDCAIVAKDRTATQSCPIYLISPRSPALLPSLISLFFFITSFALARIVATSGTSRDSKARQSIECSSS